MQTVTPAKKNGYTGEKQGENGVTGVKNIINMLDYVQLTNVLCVLFVCNANIICDVSGILL